MEALIEVVPDYPELLPSAVIYKNFSERRLLDHRKLASEEDWGSKRLGIIDAHKHSIREMVDASNVMIFDDMGYIFADVLNGSYDLRQLNRDLEQILYSVDNGKKVIIVTDNPFGLYAESIEKNYLKKGLPMGDVKKLNDLLPKFGDKNPLHREEYTDVNYMVYVDFFPQAFVFGMQRYFEDNRVKVNEIVWLNEEGIIREVVDGLSFLYEHASNPRKFITVATYIMQKKLKERKTGGEALEVTPGDMLAALKSFGTKVKDEEHIHK